MLSLLVSGLFSKGFDLSSTFSNLLPIVLLLYFCCLCCSIFKVRSPQRGFFHYTHPRPSCQAFSSKKRIPLPSGSRTSSCLSLADGSSYFITLYLTCQDVFFCFFPFFAVLLLCPNTVKKRGENGGAIGHFDHKIKGFPVSTGRSVKKRRLTAPSYKLESYLSLVTSPLPERSTGSPK